MKSTEEFITDLFTSHREARRGAQTYLTPAFRLVIMFSSIIFLGTLLLLLPWSVPANQPLSIIDAVFTSTSAVCVTGLIVRDTATAFTPFGQTVIIFLIQLGGLGYMIFATMAVVLFGRRIGVSDKATIRYAFNLDSAGHTGHFVRDVIILTLVIECIGAVLISIAYWGDHTPLRAIVLGVFHSISGFNNAGFSLFSDNLMSQGGHRLAVTTIMFLALISGLGYIVVHELLYWMRDPYKKISLHARLVLITTLVITVSGALILFLTVEMDWFNAVFLSSIGRTSGFNIEDTGHMSQRAQFLMIPLMFIGASPGGTGGGIKTTTFVIMCLAIWSTLRGQKEIVVFKRQLSHAILYKSLTIFVIMSVLLVTLTLMLEILENKDMGRILFEMTSALGTVGLSTGNGENLSMSASFSLPGKLLIIGSMLFGRLGPITIGLAVALHPQHHPHMQYPEGRVGIG